MNWLKFEDGKQVWARFGRGGEYDVNWEEPAWYEMQVQMNAKEEPVILSFKGRGGWAEYCIAKGSDMVETGFNSVLLLVEDYYCEIFRKGEDT